MRDGTTARRFAANLARESTRTSNDVSAQDIAVTESESSDVSDVGPKTLPYDGGWDCFVTIAA